MTNDSGTQQANASVPLLSEAEIALRLEFYNRGDALERDLRVVRERAADVVLAAIRDFWVEALPTIIVDMTSANQPSIDDVTEIHYRRFTFSIDRRWVLAVAKSGAKLLEFGVPIPHVIHLRACLTQLLIKRIEENFADDPTFAQLACDALYRIGIYETEITLAQIGLIGRAEAALSRHSESHVFRGEVSDILSAVLDDSRQLRGQTVATSASARGMLGKASEVAAAAEQSAVAMREAAQTAAGLIRAIEDARGEVEIAAGVATRAAEQSAEAVNVSEALSDHAQAIESILGLIRDIAGQTNLLALNATIEAARAGDAGRGFAVVAQEVKSLANQTARATDDIAHKIAAIQAATRQTVDANGSIRNTVGEVQSSAHRIRQAMETQAQTVTMITAAVDETALAADSMSSTIAAIRADTENVAGEIDRLEIGFKSVDSQLSRLETTTSDFVSRIAA
jgi:methyl-accepting chemotaxis protein